MAAMNALKRPKIPPTRQQNIPDDIVEDILVTLPAKSLLRFKCVSKSWNSLINKPDFTRTNFQRRCHHGNIILKCLYDVPPPKTLDYLDFNLVFELDVEQEGHQVNRRGFSWPLRPPESINNFTLHSHFHCDGILCVVKGFDGPFLWNPCINKYKRLPAPVAWGKGWYSVIGFGYDSAIKDYKVVIFVADSQGQPRTSKIFEVLNVKSKVWRKVYKDLPYVPYWKHSSQAELLNGGFHFLARKERINALSVNTILLFDLAEESLREVYPMPPCLEDEWGSYLDLTVLRGFLHLINNRNFFYGLDCLDLWVMKEESWFKLLTISSDHVMRPVSFTKDGKIIFVKPRTGEFLIFGTEEHICLKKFKVCDCKNDHLVVMYSDSLISPSDDD